MLEISGIDASYGNLQVLWDVSLNIGEGEIVAVLGPNGSGKTTMLKSIMNLVSVKKGKIMFLGQDITGKPIHELTKVGLAFVPEERNLFPAMTVMENLLLGAYTIRNKKIIKETFNRVFELFPRLAERKKQYAGTMSGGERQMLAIARGIMSNPKMLILDEPSMGLAPQNVLAVFETIKKLSAEKVTVLIVEQNVNTTLTVADRAYVMEQGRIVMEGSSSQLQGDDHIRKMYTGIA
ncbi:ABC transporter ATP-binding protein [Desulfosporosinus sp. BICA1-9]|uniref:ABC transporter ATP-binding protein n=1 Tax=Desulfosporosinus sp. BICA1-9 TaxID=1531958 RepID=UPI00054B41AC|nr:ABC transporter ATP-binding protein [Desulfosporosinus sp. BICA1-9]KJS85855.1 MAG: leucine/isoleucine/valine transporter ATP-binding subunit [Desulfosporosinus sp. BICA1-9]